MHRSHSFCLSVLCLLSGLTGFAEASPPAVATAATAREARLLRFADIHEDRICFVYAGDIWTVSADGGVAQRLTSDVGMELFPKFSPDGEWIAYSAEYSGNRQVWVLPTDGGTPRRLTWYNDVGPMPPRGGFDHQVLGWTPDGSQVLFRGNRLPWGVRMGRPFVVPFANGEGGMERPLAVPESGGGTLSPDGKHFVYTPISREFRTWKRYRGGRAQDVWTYDLEQDTSRRVTTFEGTDNQPVMVGETIYFTSDRDRRLNLYALQESEQEESGAAPRKVTHHEDFDVLWPSAGPRQIVYECGGWLYRFDPQTEVSTQVPVELQGDFRNTLPRMQRVGDDVQSVAISPTGKRVTVDARGDVFTVPAEHGEPRNLTRTPGIREMQPSWSPDGRWVAYLSDASGEYELYVRSQDGSGDERRLTTDGDTWRFGPVWSPDSSKLAFADTEARLRVVSVDDGALVDVDRGRHGNLTDFSWSADSSWIVYSKIDDSRFSSIFLYDLDAGRVHRVTEGATNDYAPTLDPEGRYLYFLSDRDFNLTFSGYEFNYFYTEPTRVYAAQLRSDGPALLRPQSDEESAAPEENEEEAAEASEASEEAPDDARLAIDLEGLGERVVALPGASGSYGGLQANAKGVFWIEGGTVSLFDVESEEVETVLEGVSGFELSADGEKLLFSRGGQYGIASAAAGQDANSGLLDWDGLQMRVDPRAEWQQIFVDGWRITRDWFYDGGLHGLDWQAMRELYEPLVAHVSHRGDLDYILGELGGELNAGHFYVNWGDMPRPERIESGLLGAELEAHPSGFFRIARILPGENWHPGFRSPLTEPGVDVAAGEFLVAVDGRPTSDVRNVYELFEAGAGRSFSIGVNAQPSLEGARTYDVRPVARETNLRYLEWVQQRQELVDRLSNGRIGYIHLPNTAVEGNRELRKHFYPQARKDALILDARYNGGGFIPDRMIELVSRDRLSFWTRRGIAPFDTPGFAHDGPKACLMNGYSSSGGDAFPFYFRKVGLGKLYGTRTWGGLIGLSGNPSFLDGGSLAVPTFRFVDPATGQFAVEGVGVAPDVEVLDLPEAVARGEDPTLERAVRDLLAELEANPPQRPTEPTPPRYAR